MSKMTYKKHKYNVLRGLKKRGCKEETINKLSLHLDGIFVQHILDDRCTYCLNMLDPQTFSVDHATPLSRRGRNSFNNLIICCRRCNQAKGDMTAGEWRSLLGCITGWPDYGARVISRLIASGNVFRGRR